MPITLPTDTAVPTLERYAHALAAATYTEVLDHRRELIDLWWSGHPLAARLLPTVRVELDLRPEGRRAATCRLIAQREGERQLGKRRSQVGPYQLVERSTRDNRPLWSSRVGSADADAVFRQTLIGNSTVYRPTTGRCRLVLREDSPR